MIKNDNHEIISQITSQKQIYVPSANNLSFGVSSIASNLLPLILLRKIHFVIIFVTGN